jgi:hypothetical protein
MAGAGVRLTCESGEGRRELTLNPALRDLSPELALVDPELARLARLCLPEPGSFGRPTLGEVEAAHVAAEAGLPVVRPAKELGRKKFRTGLVIVAAASLALNGVLVWHARSRGIERPFLVDRPARSSASANLDRRSQAEKRAAVLPSSKPAEAPAPKARAAAEPARESTAEAPAPKERAATRPARQGTAGRPAVARAVVSGPPGRRLRWKAVAGASYYDLILWHGGRRVLDLWPTEPRAVLSTAWSYDGKRHRLLPGRYLWFAYAGFGAKASRHYGALAGNGILVVRGSSG